MNVNGREFVMTFDYHTHTVFSHGKGTIEENVIAASEKGLREIAISDHGPGHLTYGIKRSSVPVMRKEITELRHKYPDIGIFLSVEANIVNTGSGLDVLPEEIEDYDFIIAGYHYGTRHSYCIPNYVGAHTPFGNSEKQRKKNTEMYLKAIYSNPLRILTHPGDKGPVHMDEIAKACAERGTLMEISTWHTHLTTDEIKTAMKYDVGFIISSDAHVPARVGSFEGGVGRAVEAGLELERIVNLKEI
ncbi:MAG: PHP domain-containing protein [Clostridia bacterium]|nr:PHP domain-containing protein [Clostridia bacterium]